METIKVGLVGFGTIGAGVAKILCGQTDRIAQATGRKVELAKIVDKDVTTDRGITLPAGVLTDNLSELIDDPEIKIGIELVGGLEPARTFVLKMLEAGKDVVTANKALLANHGPELFARARELNRTIAFEAAVCGGIPILGPLATSLQANRIETINAIVNGTSNFILTQMEEKGADYQTAVKEAQRLGYAEANPAMDVNGTDAVQKLTILAQLVFGAYADWKSILRYGIESVSTLDIHYARELGYLIRLIASARRTDEGIELRVSPTLVPIDSSLAKVRDAINAIEVVGDFVGSVFFQGWGAGQLPTASAVCGDVIDTLLGRTRITFDTLRLWSDSANTPIVKAAAKVVGRAYLRVSVENKPGVLAEIAGVLGRHRISIASMIQHEDRNDEKAPVSMIIMTYDAPEGELQNAVEVIDAFPFVHAKTVRLGVMNDC